MIGNQTVLTSIVWTNSTDTFYPFKTFSLNEPVASFSLGLCYFSSWKLSCFLSYCGKVWDTMCQSLPSSQNHCGVCVCFVVTSLCELQGAILRDVTYNLGFLSIPACFMQVCLSPSAHTGVKKACHNMSLTHFVFYNENNNTIVICSPPVNQGHTFEINQVSKSCWNTLFLVEMRPKCCWYIILPSPHQIRWECINIYHQSWMDDLFSDQRTEEESCPCPNLWHSVTLTSEAENHNIILTCCKCNH